MKNLLEEARLRMSIPLGSFPYDRGLGSRLRALEPDEEHMGKRAAAYAAEALLPLADTEVAGARVEKDCVFVRVTLPEGEVQLQIKTA